MQQNQKRAVQIALHRLGDSIAKDKFSLGEWLFCVCAGGMIKLAQAVFRVVTSISSPPAGFAFRSSVLTSIPGARTLTLRPKHR
jgi:hypothetical protein